MIATLVDNQYHLATQLLVFWSCMFHILTVLSFPPETIYLLSLVIATLLTISVWPRNTASCVLVLEVPYSHSLVTPTRNNIFVIIGDCYTYDLSSMPYQHSFLCFVLEVPYSQQSCLVQETIYLLSVVIAILITILK